MRILWVVNSVLNDFGKYLTGKGSNGLWMDALLEDFKKYGEHDLVVATTYPTKNTIKYEKDGVRYYALADNYPILYNENKKQNILAWKKLFREEKIDLIQVWGTEFTHGLCALRQAKDIPSVVYMQGLTGTIAKYYLAGIDYKDIKKSLTLRDIIKRDSIIKQQKKFLKAAKKEKEILELSGRIISENEWCNSNIKEAVPDIKVYDCALSINKAFGERKWDINKINRHSIMCTASGYTIKGLHMVFQAVNLLKNKYNDIKILIPGTPVTKHKGLKGLLRVNGYTKYIQNLIDKLKLRNNVVWLGNLSQEKLAEAYETAHVFMMSSSIENHSSSLKEAMMVGLPCISSAVGGIPEYVNHGENGFLYRFEEYAVAAMLINKIFEDDCLAIKLSNQARESMLKLHDGTGLYNRIAHIYNDIYMESKGK